MMGKNAPEIALTCDNIVMSTPSRMCETLTRAYPGGRTGTPAGYQAHYVAREPACRACLDAVAADQTAKASNANRDVYRQRAYERDPLVNRKANLKAKFGMSLDDYDRMLADQGGGCAVCGTTDPGGRWGTFFPIDHDRACCPGNNSCGKCIRGLTCSPCNVGLGAFGDDADRLMAAAAYLLSRRNVLEVPSGLWS
jgi:hypothetical protein